ncbi:MAG: hypothetical protein E6Q97_16645 [Desulfurellales bacterium]|nr:MAG: hypothetical protein E6Q97_16645 [Desulfurellales bacterium]
MTTCEDFDILEQVLATNAVGWTNTQKDLLRQAASDYVNRAHSKLLLEREVMAVQVRAIAHGSGTDASWSVFATWLVRRAGSFGQYMRDMPT